MTGFKNLLLAFTVLSASTAAFAADDNVASLALGKTGERPKKSLVLHSVSTNGVVSHDSAWSAQLGQPNHQTDYCATTPTCRSLTMALNSVRRTSWAAMICLELRRCTSAEVDLPGRAL